MQNSNASSPVILLDNSKTHSRDVDTAPEREWRETITPHTNIFSLNLKELWAYRDLLMILTRRDIIALYKQTILGPLWFVLQPVLTTITFIIVFFRAAKLKTMDLPPVLFYMSGLVLWAYFSECVVRISTFFKDASPVLGKVYFPRLIVPMALILTNLVRFALQLGLFFVIYLYYLFIQKTPIVPNSYALLLPVLVLMVALLGLGAGMIIASLTTRYKDLVHLTTFGIQLLMYTSTVIFPMTSLGTGIYGKIIKANPMTGIIEAFRFAFLGKGGFSWGLLGYDAICVVVLLILGIITFNSVERSFVDSI